MTERSLRVAMIALALATLPACELLSDDPLTPAGSDSDLTRFGETLDSLVASLEPITFARERVAEAADVVREDGADLDVLRSRRQTGADPGIELAGIPQHLHGAVYVRNPSTHAYERDVERTDGPADGIRIVHYRRTSNGEFLIPLAEAGSVDVTQEDPDVERFGIAVRDVEGTVQEAFTIEGEDTQDTRTREIEGTLGADPPVTVSMTSVDEAFPEASLASFEGELDAAGFGRLRVHWDRYLQEESENAEYFQEGAFSFEMDTESAFAQGYVQFTTDRDGTEEIEGFLDFGGEEAVALTLSGTLAAPSFEGAEDLSAADRALIEQLWADLVAFVDAWWVPIGS